MDRDLLRQAWSFATSTTGLGVLKCSLAYVLGCMATFLAPIAAFLGHQDGRHIVATITVYFHSARSQGSMLEATIYASLAFLYASLISFASMGVSVAFNSLDMQVLGHAVVLIVFCGGGLGFVGWLKQIRGDPLVNVACSLASLALITVLTKEGSVQASKFSFEKIVQVMKMVVMGICATAFVCLVVKPISARNEIRQAMIEANDCLGDMLDVITRSFLKGSDDEMRGPQFKKETDEYAAVFASLEKHLKEAKFEHYVWGTEDLYKVEVKLVACMQRLSQSIGGLRSAAATQFSLSSRSIVGSPAMMGSPDYLFSPSVMSSAMASAHSTFSALPAIDESAEEGPEANQEYFNGAISGALARSHRDVFSLFIRHLGPSMETLANTMKEMLAQLPYGSGPSYSMPQNTAFQAELSGALRRYSQARDDALKLLYKNKEASQVKSVDVAADFEEIAASCGHFSYSLQEFADAMRIYLDFLDELRETLGRPEVHRSWSWLSFRRLFPKRDQQEQAGDCEHSPRRNDAERSLRGFGLPRRGETNVWVPKWKRKPKGETLSQRAWRAVQVLGRDDIRFAIKVGIGAAIWALPSFVAYTRPFYSRWRGEWGLLSYMLVCSMHIGSSNTTGYSRFLGTCTGAVFAIIAWLVTGGNAFGLTLFAWVMSLWCFYIIVAQGKGPMGRFILLTYNLSALYAYSLSVQDGQDDGDEGGKKPQIIDITVHRVMAVMTGCLWGLVVTRVIFPISARQNLKDGLSLLWLKIGLILKRDPFALLLERDPSQAYSDMAEQCGLQEFLANLKKMHTAAGSEIDFKGPFQTEAFDRMLKCTSKVLDTFHAMNVVIKKDLRASEGEKRILEYTAAERRQLSGRIGHLFQVLASSLKLEYPLNDSLPSTEHSRDRLLAKIYAFRNDTERGQTTSEEDFALIYIYVLVTVQLSDEIGKLGDELANVYGIQDDDLLKME